MQQRRRAVEGAVLRALWLACSIAAGGLRAEEASAPTRVSPAPARRQSRAADKAESAAAWHARRGLQVQRTWGVDLLGLRPVSSGLMLRFDYRVIDAEKAAALNDHKAKAYLIDEATGIALAVPAMEKVGELRQVAPPEPDRNYFIIFGNPGRLMKRGSRATVVIGNFRAEGLPVE